MIRKTATDQNKSTFLQSQAQFQLGATLRKIANLGIPYDNKTPEQLLKDSVSALQAASQLAPHEPSFYNNLGLSQFECGEYENAIQNYD